MIVEDDEGCDVGERLTVLVKYQRGEVGGSSLSDKVYWRRSK